MSTAENDRRELGGRSSSRRAIAESHSVARKQAASKFSSRRGALVEGNDLYRAKMGVTEAREIAREIARGWLTELTHAAGARVLRQ